MPTEQGTDETPKSVVGNTLKDSWQALSLPLTDEQHAILTDLVYGRLMNREEYDRDILALADDISITLQENIEAAPAQSLSDNFDMMALHAVGEHIGPPRLKLHPAADEDDFEIELVPL
ncbi:MAG: hypothetical protein LRZ85_00245 [Alphaproteobacteria bacterium]|nr:hypothetical protein [Alphaproteobacteria bacterium]MCD8520483.1 hypothetical protein [Alphaproteobacteria bacterium]MCD8571181.1 hypothetical protein [Alphaproteobacteria bacterium]